MARVPYLSVDDVAPEHKHLLERPITLHQALINSPVALTHFQRFAEWMRWECELDPRERELVILQVGYLTGDPYEWSHHIVLGKQFGVTDDDVQAIVDLNEGREAALSEHELLLLRAATEITQQQAASDETWAALAERYDAGRLTDLVLVIAFYSMVVRVLSTLRIDVEPEFQAALDRFPLPHAQRTSLLS